MKASDVKKGNVIEHEGNVYQVRDFERSSPGARGGNITFRFVLYSIPGGRKFELSLRSEDEVQEMDLVRRAANFSYMDDGAFVFMDAEDYTQYPLSPELVGDNAGYIVEGIEGYYVQLIDDAPVGLQVPSSVILTVVDTSAGNERLQRDQAQQAGKAQYRHRSAGAGVHQQRRKNLGQHIDR